MKNVVKKSKLLVSALVLTMVVSMLTACSSSNALLTKWTVDYAESNGVTVSAEVLEEQGFTMSLEFKKDGIVTATVTGLSVEGTYTQDGSTVSITFNEETQELKFEKNVLSWENEDVGTIYFKK